MRDRPSGWPCGASGKLAAPWEWLRYFKELAADTGIPYQTLINWYLRDCAASKRRPTMRWTEPKKGAA